MGMVRVARTAPSGTLNVAGLAPVSPGFAKPEKSYATLKDSPPAGAASLRVTNSEAFCPSEMSPRGMNPPGPEIEKVFVSCAGGGAARSGAACPSRSATATRTTTGRRRRCVIGEAADRSGLGPR